MSQRILVVDDDGTVLRTVARVLTHAGYHVLKAEDVDGAIRHAQSGPLDAAIVDYVLPKDTGLTVLSKLQEIQPKCVRILITGRSDSKVMIDAINQGEVAKLIQKPFARKSLLAELESAFASAQRLKEVNLEDEQQAVDAERRALEAALQKPNIKLALQAIIDTDGRGEDPFAYEALLRPQTPDVPNALALIELAVRHGRLPELGRSILELARRRFESLPSHLSMFINLHPLQLSEPSTIQECLAPLIPQAHRIIFEITEQWPLHKIERWEESVDWLTSSGFSIAIDDLGAGYASLSILADIKPTYIKLDMGLVRGVDQQPRKQRLVQFLRKFGDATEATIIAEGVETAEERAALRACGVHLMQGYLWGKPSLTPDFGPPS